MIVLLAVLAVALSAIAVRVFIVVARRRLLALPGDRSSHTSATPTGGGLPMILVFVLVASVAVALGTIAGGPRYWAALACGVVLAPLGLWDDAVDLSRGIRILVQLGVAVAVVALLDRSGGDLLAEAAAVLLIVALINAFNFMDGIDALVGGTGLTIVCFLAVWTGDGLWWLLAASVAGFLPFNVPPARIFMGDAGATALGALVGVALLSEPVLAPRHWLVLAVLMGDTAYTLGRRLWRRENILQGHHSHLYQRLLRAGHSHGAISAGYAAATLACGLLGWFAGAAGAIAVLVAGCVVVAAIERHVVRRGVPFTRTASG